MVQATVRSHPHQRELFSWGFLLLSLPCYRSRPKWGQEQRTKFLETARKWLNTSACMNCSPRHFLCSVVLQRGQDKASAQTAVSVVRRTEGLHGGDDPASVACLALNRDSQSEEEQRALSTFLRVEWGPELPRRAKDKTPWSLMPSQDTFIHLTGPEQALCREMQRQLRHETCPQGAHLLEGR